MKIYAYNPKGFIYVINRTNTSLISIRCSLSYCELGDIFEMSNVLLFHYYDDAVKQFKKDAQKEVNYLIKEFECKKAASNYARANVSRTGVLDCTKLHTYKYNEDLFKKVTTIADGKNHGLIFILDWSGSMLSLIHI